METQLLRFSFRVDVTGETVGVGERLLPGWRGSEEGGRRVPWSVKSRGGGRGLGGRTGRALLIRG